MLLSDPWCRWVGVLGDAGAPNNSGCSGSSLLISFIRRERVLLLHVRAELTVLGMGLDSCCRRSNDDNVWFFIFHGLSPPFLCGLLSAEKRSSKCFGRYSSPSLGLGKRSCSSRPSANTRTHCVSCRDHHPAGFASHALSNSPPF